MSVAVLRVVLALSVLSVTGCSLPTLLHKNLDAIQASTAAITSNNEVVKESTSVSQAGIRSEI